MARSSLEHFKKVDPSSRYSVLEVLGEGSYGIVYRGKSSSNEECAIKILRCEFDNENLSSVAEEISILKSVRSPYVVSFRESYIFNNEMWIIMECCGGGSLTDLMEIMKFQEEEIRAVMAYCCLGLHHLHSRKCIHRDIKSGNILLTLDGKAKISDFGVSAQLSSSMMKRKTIIGSPFWMAPEMIEETSYDGKADIWSLGITLYELCTGHPPHYNVSPLRAIFMISSKPAPKLPSKRTLDRDSEIPPCEWSLDLQDFIGKCLVKDTTLRCGATELLDHPFIADYVSIILENEGQNSDGDEERKGLSVLIDLVDDHLPALKAAQKKKINPRLSPSTCPTLSKMQSQCHSPVTRMTHLPPTVPPLSLSILHPIIPTLYGSLFPDKMYSISTSPSAEDKKYLYEDPMCDTFVKKSGSPVHRTHTAHTPHTTHSTHALKSLRDEEKHGRSPREGLGSPPCGVTGGSPRSHCSKGANIKTALEYLKDSDMDNRSHQKMTQPVSPGLHGLPPITLDKSSAEKKSKHRVKSPSSPSRSPRADPNAISAISGHDKGDKSELMGLSGIFDFNTFTFEGRKEHSKLFFLTALETMPRSKEGSSSADGSLNSKLDLLSATQCDSNNSITLPVRSMMSHDRADGRRGSEGSPKTHKEIMRLLSHLESDHKSSMSDLITTYNSRRDNLLAKLQSLEVQ